MTKFNTPGTRATGRHPITTERHPSGRTHEGAAGYARDTQSALFLLAVTNMVGEKTFYESAASRDNRFGELTRALAAQPDPDLWLTRFAGWLRNSANMRSASLVLAAEVVHARLAAGLAGGNRQIINSVLQRADEPGEFLAYWHTNYGRNLPQPVKRGVGDAATRLYTERSAIKYDTASHSVRFADVIRLTHAAPKAEWQSDLFTHLVGARLGVEDLTIPESLLMLRENAAMKALTPKQAVDLLFTPNDITDNASTALAAAGMTWEQIPSLINGPWTDAMWEAIIPSMGYMALLRNLRNFDQAGVSDEVAERVCKRLVDPEQVARSRQFPFRFYSAYKHTNSLRWAYALEKALGMSLANVPPMPGRTLILVDQSPSMFPGYYFSTRNSSDITLAEQAALFGSALALRAESADLVGYGTNSYSVPFTQGEAVLRTMTKFHVEDGTDTAAAVVHRFKGHDRIVIVTDEQTQRSRYGRIDDHVPAGVPVYTWNLGGYQHGHAPSGSRNRYTFGGLTDQMFAMIPLLERGANTSWPF